ncbi:MAG: lasso peptide biosynthesis PqqD family chaperone [Chloroflexi bacterium]|nr:lasso peptide biosynthesis PqqD family chaperone [Chloroflexota bacterium]
MSPMITERSIITAAQDQVSVDLDGEVVILNLKDGVYYGLETVGARVWELIQEPKTLKEILETLLQEYDVEPDRCARELQALLEDLAAKELIEVREDTL